MGLHHVLKPIANHITMVQQLHLARTLTCSKLITAPQGFKIKHDAFTATVPIHELIDKADAGPHRVISIINGCISQHFEQWRNLLKSFSNKSICTPSQLLSLLWLTTYLHQKKVEQRQLQ
jgi:hypothetical protein